MAVINGHIRPEEISGTMGDDRIRGKGGADTIFGLGGGDRIFGEGGDDTLYDDIADIFGQPLYPGGADQVDGGAGNDTIELSFGNDTADGGGGDDTIRDFLETDDVMIGGAGNDRLIDYTGADVFEGGTGNDYIVDGYFLRTGPDDGADRYIHRKTKGGFGDDTILGFDQGYGDRIEFRGYRPADLVSQTETERATVFTFTDGSVLTAYQDERQILHDMLPGRDFIFA